MPDTVTASTPPQAEALLHAPRPTPGLRQLVPVLALTLVLGLGGLFGPSLVGGTMDMSMSMGMTHYMELLATNQPLNLLLYMGVPVVLAETLAISEIAMLVLRPGPAWVARANHVAGLLAGPAMLAITLHLLVNAVLPLTATGGWRGPADVIAVLAYLSGVVPFVAITLVELGLVGRTERQRTRLRALWISVFLVVAHVAMIFGMLNPGVLGFAMHH